MMKHLPELLCPAGDMEALSAAVDCGADAVYLGYKAYGARASAVNFDAETLLQAVSYAHLYHVRVHVTVNTLVKQAELEGVFDALSAIQAAGADAVIVQDLGVARLVREHFAALELHASTQMALSNVSDAAFAKEMGFSRVVLARECSLSEVRRVAESGIETEVFAHGALCAGVSGRCLMSSMAGGRSGNRGRCAQPCRMQMNLGGLNNALLSLRDLCTYEDLPTICEAGISSLKIEGRLKGSEYVAVVTETYRRALDDIAAGRFDPSDTRPRERLMQVFNRGGFTRGHIMGAEDAELCASGRVSHEGLPIGEIVGVNGGLAQMRVTRTLNDGDSLQLRENGDIDLRYSGHRAAAGDVATLRLRPGIRVSPGCQVARLSDARQLESARAHQPKPLPITMMAVFAADKPMTLSLSDGETSVCVQGEPVQRAAKRSATVEDAVRQLVKLGDTPFVLAKPEDLMVSLDDGLFLPVSALNALRREGVALLVKARVKAFAKPAPATETHAPDPCGVERATPPLVTAQTLAVAFNRPELAEGLRAQGAKLLIYRPVDYREEPLAAALQRLPLDVWLDLPPQAASPVMHSILKLAKAHKERLSGLVAESFGQLCLDIDLPVIAGSQLPITNREAVRALRTTSAAAFVLWPEWSFAEQLELLPHGLPALLTVYGRETLMLLNHCPARAARGMTSGRAHCDLCSDAAMACGLNDPKLRDSKGFDFPLRRTAYPEGCTISVLNALPTDLSAFEGDRRRLGAGMLLSFTCEPPAQQLALTAAYAALMQGDMPPKAGETTAGHWRRGVE